MTTIPGRILRGPSPQLSIQFDMSSTPEPKKKRSCLGSFCMGGVGCASFALGALAILILLLPRICGAWVPGLVEKTFAQTFRGTLEVGDARLAWSERQVLDDVVLRDPDGGEVGRVTIVVPSILDFASDERKTIEIELAAELAADDAGVTNLARAFERRPETKVDLEGAKDTDPDDERLLDELDLELVLTSHRLSWSDADTRARGEPFVVRDLKLVVSLTPGGRKALDLDALLPGATPSPLAVDAAYEGKLRSLVEGDLHGLAVDAKAKGLSVALVDALAGLQGALIEALGPAVDVALHVADPFGPRGRVSVDVAGEERHLRFEGGMQDGAFRIAEDAPLSAAVGLPFDLAARLVRPYLPQGAQLVAGDRFGAITFDAYSLVVPEHSIASFRAGDYVRGLRGVRGHVALELPVGVYYTDPTTQATGVILGLTSGHVEVRTQGEGEPLQGTIYAAIETGVPGDVEFSFKLGRDGTTEPDLAYFDLQVRQISSTAVDGYLELGGCFFEAMGETFGFRAEGDGLTRAAGELMAYVRATGLSGNIHGHVQDGVLLLEPEHGLNAVFRPAPGWFERCIAREVGGWSVNLLLGEDEGLRFLTDGTTFPLPATWTRDGVVEALTGAFGKTTFRLGTLRFARTVEGVEQIVGFENIELAAAMSEDGALDVSLESGLYTGSAGSFRLQTRVPGAPDVLRGGDAAGVELDVEASGISNELLREVLAPFLPEGATLAIDAAKEVQLHWNGGGFRRGAVDPLAALSGDATLALGGLRYASESFGVELTDVTASVELGADVAVVLDAGLAPGLPAGLIGDRLRADVTLLGPGAVTGAGGIEARVETPLLTLSGAGRFEGGALRAEGKDALRLEWRPTAASLRELLGGSLAPGQSLEPSAAAPVVLALTEVRVPLGSGDGPGADRSSLAELRAEAELSVPPLVFRDRTLAEPIELAGLHGVLSVRPGEPATLALRGTSSGSGPAPLGVRVASLAPLGGSATRVEVELRAASLPTPLIDALARADGLVVDVFGPTVDVAATSPSLGSRDGAFHAEISSPRASTTVDGELADGVVRTAQGSGLNASMGLTPLFSKRIVGSLLPLVVGVTKPEGAGPCGLRVSDVAFPLDGDLSGLDAVVELDLGDVAYRLLPGIEESFLQDLTQARVRRVPPLTVRIADGVAHYDGLPIQVDGRDIGFRGSFGLVDRKLSFDAKVPLSVLGDDIAKKADGYVGSDVAVPVRIAGTTTRPSFTVSIESLLQEAAGSLLNRWLRR